MRTQTRTLMDEELRTCGEERDNRRWLGSSQPHDLGAEVVRLARLAAAVHMHSAARSLHSTERAT
jgi:hypothetical protein